MFRFTIRDLLGLTLLVALCCGWWLNSQWWQGQVAKLQESERLHEASLARAEDRAAGIHIRAEVIKERHRELSRRFKSLAKEIEKAGYCVSVNGDEVTVQPPVERVSD